MEFVKAFHLLFLQEIVYTSDMLFHYTTTKLIYLGYKSVQELTVVGYDNYRSIKLFDSLFQYIFGTHIQMVGRLVQYKEVHRFKQKFYHCQTAAFSSGKDFHLLIRSLTTEHESPKDITYLQTDITFCHTVYCVEYCYILIKELCLILCEISYLYVMSYHKFSLVRNLVHDTLDKCRFTFTVLSYESNLLTSVYCKSDIMEHHMITICLLYILAYHRIVSRTDSRRELQPQRRSILIVYLYRYNLFKLLYAALHLNCLCSLISETFDKLFGILNLLLLVFVCTKLLLTAFLAQNYEFIIRYLIIINMST